MSTPAKILLPLLGLLVVLIIAIAVSGGSKSSAPDPIATAKAQAARLTPARTARRIERDYQRRGIAGKVTCHDFDTTTQLCRVTDHGNVVANLRVKLSLATGALDVQVRP